MNYTISYNEFICQFVMNPIYMIIIAFKEKQKENILCKKKKKKKNVCVVLVINNVIITGEFILNTVLYIIE